MEAATDVASAAIRCFGSEAPEAANYVTRILDLLAKMAVSKHSSPEERSLGYGALADMLDALGISAGAYANKLYNCLTRGLRDEEVEVRHNSVYALGSLCQYGALALGASRLDEVVAACERMISSGGEDEAVRDNALSTMCRALRQRPDPSARRELLLAIANKAILPLVPLQGDQRETATVLDFLSWLIPVLRLDVSLTGPWLDHMRRVADFLHETQPLTLIQLE